MISARNITVDTSGRADFFHSVMMAQNINLLDGGIIRVRGNGFDAISDGVSHIQAVSIVLENGGSIAVQSGSISCETLEIEEVASCGISCATLISLDLAIHGAHTHSRPSLISNNGIVEVYTGNIHINGTLVAMNSRIEADTGSIIIGGNEPEYNYLDTVASEIPHPEDVIPVGGTSSYSVDISNTDIITGAATGQLVIEGGGDLGVFRAHSDSYVSVAGDFSIVGDAGAVLDLSASVFEVLGQLYMSGSMAGRSSIAVSNGARIASASHWIEVAELRFVDCEQLSDFGDGQAFVAQFVGVDRSVKPTM